jgi:hypothetical protein
MLYRLLLLFATIMGCGGKPKHPPTNTVSNVEKLQQKFESYLAWSDSQRDSYGWIDDTKCDGLLFNSLYAVAGGHVDIEAAQAEPGRWYRHAAQDCYEKGESGSTISRDMFTGLFLWIWKEKRLELIESIIEYGQARRDVLGNWIMGDGDIFRITMTPSMRATACELAYRLGGSERKLCRSLPQFFGPCSDYECHLQALDIDLRGELLGGITDAELRRLEILIEGFPHNALFAAIHAKYTDGNMDKAIALLLDEKLFPPDRMPQSSDRCTFYLYQRDEVRNSVPNPDWLPCPEYPEEFAGIDFLYASSIILGRLKL